MNYKVIDSSPETWKIVKTSELNYKQGDSVFKTLKEAKKYLIDTCLNEIEYERDMIKEVRALKIENIEDEK